MTRYYFNYHDRQLPNCCGVREIGDFEMDAVTDEMQARDAEARYPRYRAYIATTETEAYKQAFDKILASTCGFVVQFWFKNPTDYDGDWEGYEHDELRQLVKAHPNCVELAEYVNPNSGNVINGFMILNNLSMEPHNDDED